MAGGYVTLLVRNHADQLSGLGGALDQAGVEEEVQAAGDEGVEARIVDEVDPHVPGIERGGLEDWRRIGADDTFDLGVANQPGLLLSLRSARSAERRVGKEWVSTCRSRWSPYH